MKLHANRAFAIITFPCLMAVWCEYSVCQENDGMPDFGQLLEKARFSSQTTLVKIGDGNDTEITFEAFHIEQLEENNYRLFGTVPSEDNDSSRRYVDCLIKYPAPWLKGYIYPSDLIVQQSEYGSIRIRAWYGHLMEIRELPEPRLPYYNELQAKFRAVAELFADFSEKILVDIAFEDGTQISGFATVRDPANLDALFDFGGSTVTSAKRFIQECRAQAVVSAQRQETVLAAVVLGRTARIVPSNAQGFVTDTYSWMNMNTQDDITPIASLCKQVDAALDDGLYSFRLIDESSAVHTLYAGDFMAVKQIVPVADDALKNRLNLLYYALREKTESFNYMWEFDRDGDFLLTFKDSAPFYGKLIEYVPSYQFNTLIYAVAVRKNGEYRVLQSIDAIEGFRRVSAVFDENEKQLIQQEENAYAQGLIPEEPAELEFAPTTASPAPKFLETGNYSSHYLVEIKGHMVHSAQFIEKITAGKVTFPYQSATIVEIFIECSVDETQKSAVVSAEDFLVYDNDGIQVTYKGILVDGRLSSSTAVQETPAPFSVMCVVQDAPSELFVRFLDTKPSKIKLKP
ncbi:hypothetical protein KDK77_00410 [bacterium]|nr:hypothetical protein [bacterium]